MGKPTRGAPINTADEAAEVPASEVRNAWHMFVARISQTREEIVVTRCGKPVMKLSPVESSEEAKGLFGYLSGTVTIHGNPPLRWTPR